MQVTAQQLQLTFDAPPPATNANQVNITAPFAGTREGFVAGWLLQYRDKPPVPTLNRTVSGTGFTYLPVVWGLAPSISVHTHAGGGLYLCNHGWGISLGEAVEKGLAWRIESKQ